MTKAVFVQNGEAIDYTPSSNVAAGDVVVLNDLVGIAKQPIPAGALGALHVAGVFELPKDAADQGFDAGKHVQWSIALQRVILQGTGNDPYLGKLARTEPSGSDRCLVRVSQ